VKHDQTSSDDLDPIEAAFFGSDPFELDWEPSGTLPRETRVAMHATVGMLALALVGVGAFLIHAQWFMPAPESLGTHAIELPQPPPPTAARATTPSAG